MCVLVPKHFTQIIRMDIHLNFRIVAHFKVGRSSSRIVSPALRLRMDIFRALLAIFGYQNNNRGIDVTLIFGGHFFSELFKVVCMHSLV